MNRYTETSQREVDILRLDAEWEAEQTARVQRLRETRDNEPVRRALDALKRGAEGHENLLPLMRDALIAQTTVGEVCDALRSVFGVYQPAVAL